MEINEFTVDKLADPMGLIEGERYEFRLYITLDEEDELYSKDGTGIRAIFAVDEDVERIAMAHFFDRGTDKVLDFELEEDEMGTILEFCKKNIQK